MALRPVEKVLLQTLEDIDPLQAERLKAELFELTDLSEQPLFRERIARLLEGFFVAFAAWISVEAWTVHFSEGSYLGRAPIVFPILIGFLLIFYAIGEDPLDIINFRLPPKSEPATIQKNSP